jgi:hypothetical protein
LWCIRKNARNIQDKPSKNIYFCLI